MFKKIESDTISMRFYCNQLIPELSLFSCKVNHNISLQALVDIYIKPELIVRRKKSFDKHGTYASYDLADVRLENHIILLYDDFFQELDLAANLKDILNRIDGQLNVLFHPSKNYQVPNSKDNDLKIE